MRDNSATLHQYIVRKLGWSERTIYILYIVVVEGVRKVHIDTRSIIRDYHRRMMKDV